MQHNCREFYHINISCRAENILTCPVYDPNHQRKSTECFDDACADMKSLIHRSHANNSHSCCSNHSDYCLIFYYVGHGGEDREKGIKEGSWSPTRLEGNLDWIPFEVIDDSLNSLRDCDQCTSHCG